MAQLPFRRLVPVLILSLILGWFVLAITIDRVFARRQPQIALAWNKGSAEANVRFADKLLQGEASQAAISRAAELARRSFIRQPVNPGAARLLAIEAAAQGNVQQGEALARYAEDMSRRDLPTQLWLIETNVSRGDIRGALRHYDRAMRTSVTGRTTLFPILAAAADDPEIWRPLADVLAQRPQWWRAFVDQLIPRSKSPDALYAIARRTGIAQAQTADPGLLQGIEKRLVDLGAFRQAADLFNRAHGFPPASGAPLRNGGFEQPGGWDPFQWNLIDEPDLTALRQPSPITTGGNALFITAANGRGGDAATQLVILPPGRHVLTANVGDVDGDPLAFPRFVLRCAADGRELLNTPFPTASESGRMVRLTFSVPADCRAQRVVIRASSSLTPSSSSPWVDNVAIQPERTRNAVR